MVAVPLGITHTRNLPKQISMMFTHMVYDVSFGAVDISKPCAGAYESILLHTLVESNVGLFMTLPHSVQGIFTVHVLLSCVPRWLLCRWALFTQGTG